MEIIHGWDVVVDGVDDFPTRYLLNDAYGAPAVPSCRHRSSASTGSCPSSSPTRVRATAACSGAPPRRSWRPPAAPTASWASSPGTMGLLQAAEVIKLILGVGEPAIGRLLLYDALRCDARPEASVQRDPEYADLLGGDPTRSPTRRWAPSPSYEAFAPRPGRLRAARTARGERGDDQGPRSARLPSGAEGGLSANGEKCRRRAVSSLRATMPRPRVSCSPPRASSTAT